MLIRTEEGHTVTKTQGRRPCEDGGGEGLMLPQAKECQALLGNLQRVEASTGQFVPGSLWKKPIILTP